MATLDYVEIPSCATRLHSSERKDNSRNLRPAPKVVTSLPHPLKTSLANESSGTGSPISPTRSSFGIQQMFLSSALQIPANAPASPRAAKGIPRLLSTKDPLSIPISTGNFKRFVSKVGPVFWLQDRIEEIVMWRKGNRYTVVWMVAYAFLCYFPRVLVVMPILILLGAVLATHPSLREKESSESMETRTQAASPALPSQTGEGSVGWLSNVQAIQNLMGAFSDAHDTVYPVVPYLTHSSRYTPIVMTIATTIFIFTLPIINLIPIRLTALTAGLFPLFLTHPFTLYTLSPLLLASIQPQLKTLHTRAIRLIDNDRLEDKHWKSELREVELWENERWASAASLAADDGFGVSAGWSKSNLKPTERKPWTRGRDGWSGVGNGGEVSSNLTFSLSPGWLFVETEDWRPDLEGAWVTPTLTDDNGWVYTNDAWMDPRPVPLEEWKTANGMTRRRRWVRRIYYDPVAAV